MTFAERVHAVAKKGFTDRQAAFLVTVMLHSGVCIGRQYCAYARIVRGQKVYDFFGSLVAKKFATSYAAAHRRNSRVSRKVGGTQTRQQCSPSWCLAQRWDVDKSRSGCARGLPRMSLSVNRLRTGYSRGAFCRACVRGGAATTAEQQPGRERPPLPPPRSGPGRAPWGSLTPHLVRTKVTARRPHEMSVPPGKMRPHSCSLCCHGLRITRNCA